MKEPRTFSIVNQTPSGRRGKVVSPKIETFSSGHGKVEGREPTFSITIWTADKYYRLELDKERARDLVEYFTKAIASYER